MRQDADLKPSTVANYRKYLRLHILPVIGKYRLANVSAEQLQALINDMVSAGYSRNTVTGVKGILSNSMNYAVQPLHYIKASPMAFVKIPNQRKGNNPMVGATVACAVAVEEAMK